MLSPTTAATPRGQRDARRRGRRRDRDRSSHAVPREGRWTRGWPVGHIAAHVGPCPCPRRPAPVPSPSGPVLVPSPSGPVPLVPQRSRNPIPSGSVGSSSKCERPARWAVPSTSVITAALASDRRLAGDATGEGRVDDAPVAEGLPGPAGGPPAWRSANRADVPLPHGERSTSPSAKTVTLRWVRAASSPGAVGSSCHQMIAVDAAQLRLVRMDDVEGRVERRTQLALEIDEHRQAGTVDREPEHAHVGRAVERAAIADVDGHGPPGGRQGDPGRQHERRHVREADRSSRGGRGGHSGRCRRGGRTGRRPITVRLRPGHRPGARTPGPTSRARSCRARTPSSSPRYGRRPRRESAPASSGGTTRQPYMSAWPRRLVDEEAPDVVDVLSGEAARRSRIVEPSSGRDAVRRRSGMARRRCGSRIGVDDERPSRSSGPAPC